MDGGRVIGLDEQDPHSSCDERAWALSIVAQQPSSDARGIADWLHRLCREATVGLEVRGAGIRAVLAFPLQVGAVRFGVLTLLADVAADVIEGASNSPTTRVDV